MVSEEFLSEHDSERIREIGKADLLIGLPTYNNAETISPIVQSVLSGLQRSFPHRAAVLVQCDGGSQDNTVTLFRDMEAHPGIEMVSVQLPSPPIHQVLYLEQEIPRFNEAVRTILTIAELLQTEACAIIHGNIASITPDWVGRLLSPVTERSFDFVAPLFSRHKYEGSLTNSIIYPLSRALYGKQVRYHGGGGCGISRKLGSQFLSKDVWSRNLVQWGMENWMTTTSITEGYEICHASLGNKVLHPKPLGIDVSGILSSAVGSVFELMEELEPVWEGRRGSSPVPLFGPPCEFSEAPMPVNRERMVQAFRQGLRDLLPIWAIILSQETMAQILPLGILDVEDFKFPIETWVQVIYDFSLAYHEKTIHREHVLKALTPLYLGRTASFILEVQHSSSPEVEKNIEILCEEFELHKSSFRERWR